MFGWIDVEEYGILVKGPKGPSREPIERGLEIQEVWKLGNLGVWMLGGLEARKTGGLEARRLGGGATELL